MRYIMYLHNSMGGFELDEATSIADARDLLLVAHRNSFYQITYADLYMWTEEDWEEAKDFADTGCPFDYPMYLLEIGPRGGVRVEKA
jgi:hypothetical protein